MDYKVKQWIRRNHMIINLLSAGIGLLLFIIGMSLKSNQQYPEIISVFLSEVGLALITNAVLLALSLLYFKEDDDFKDARRLYKEIGLVSVYDKKSDINDKINNQLLGRHHIKEYDIICCGGLSTLRREQGSQLIDYIQSNDMKIRILTANPNLDYLLQQKIDEESELTTEVTYNTASINNSIQTDIFNLQEWVDKTKKTLKEDKKNNIQIKFYNSLPPLQYHRVGAHVFVGKAFIGKNSQSTPTIEYFDVDSPRSYYHRYTEYFEALWNDPNYAQSSPNAKLNAQLITSDRLINNILKLSCSDICQCLNEENINKVRAVLSICGYPKPLKENELRRFNTNIARGDEVCSLEESNDKSIYGHKIGYSAFNKDQVVGRANKDGKIHFDVTKEPGRYSILSIPLKNNSGTVVANISFEFANDFNDRLGISNNDEVNSSVNSEKSQEVIKRGLTWATLVSMYLGIENTANSSTNQDADASSTVKEFKKSQTEKDTDISAAKS